jgi:hypothetical protein
MGGRSRGQRSKGGCSLAPPWAGLPFIFAFEQRVDSEIGEVALTKASGVDSVFAHVFLATHKSEANKRGKCGDSSDNV